VIRPRPKSTPAPQSRRAHRAGSGTGSPVTVIRILTSGSNVEKAAGASMPQSGASM
jgi:hypothetical protein